MTAIILTIMAVALLIALAAGIVRFSRDMARILEIDEEHDEIPTLTDVVLPAPGGLEAAVRKAIAESPATKEAVRRIDADFLAQCGVLPSPLERYLDQLEMWSRRAVGR